MLKSISVQNYRGFSEPTTLEIRPITVLLGKNSSGKSSITRLVPLLQQSMERKSSSPILWTSDVVDLGNIHDVITHGHEDKDLRIGLRVEARNYGMYHRRGRYSTINRAYIEDSTFSYSMRLKAEGIRTVLCGIEIEFQSQILSISVNSEGFVERFSINGRKYESGRLAYQMDTKSLFPSVSPVFEKEVLSRQPRAPLFYEPLREALANVLHGRTASEKVDFLARNFSYMPIDRARDDLLNFPNVVQRKLTEDNIRILSDASMINDLPEILRFLELTIYPTFRNSAYIGPSRASGKRFDRIQELSVERLDPTGENTAMYIYSLNESERHSFNELLVSACGYSLMVEESGPGHVSIKVGRQGQAHFENIADVGFGFSQLIPVVAQLHAVRERGSSSTSFFSDSSIFAVEQPELHLHPAMQANLADLFVGATKKTSNDRRSTSLIIETHSESLISRLGMLIAGKQISAGDVAIYFAEKDEMGGHSKLIEAKFDQDGLIDSWPIGFFSAF